MSYVVGAKAAPLPFDPNRRPTYSALLVFRLPRRSWVRRSWIAVVLLLCCSWSAPPAPAADGRTIYLGTGENNSSRTSYAGTGVFKTTDSGKTWSNVGLTDSHHIGRVVVDPRSSETVYVAATGHLYTDNAERGIYKTTDGG